MAQQKPSWITNKAVFRRSLWLMVAAVSSFWYVHAAVYGSSVLFLPQEQTQQATKEATTLEAGIKLERELTAGEKHIYQVALTGGQYARLTVEQRGIDVVVRWLGPDGKQLAEADFEGRLQKEETAEIVAEQGGSYRVVIEAKQRNERGGYAVVLGELHAATENDRLLHEARGLYAESVRLLRAGKYVEALPPCRQALEIREKILGLDHYLVAASLNVLGNLHISRGDLVKAESSYGRALEIREKVLGPDHPDVASTLNNIAELNRRKGDYTRAEALYRRALEIKEKALGPDHSDVVAALNNLAYLFNDRNDESAAAKAVPPYRRALEIRERVLGAEHRDTLTALNNLANALRNSGDFEKAEPLYQRALGMSTKLLGPEQPDLASTLSNLAELHRLKTDYARAEPMFRRALEIQEKVLAPNHLDIAVTLTNLAFLHNDRGEFAKAEPLFQRALEIRESVLVEHRDVATSLTNLGYALRGKGDLVRAEASMLRALQIREKFLGPNHQAVAAALMNLGSVQLARGDFDKAQLTYERALGIGERTLGPNDPLVAQWLTQLGNLHYERNDYAKAEQAYRRALEINQKALGPDHRRVADSLRHLALLYRARGDSTSAEPLYLRALAISQKAFVPENDGVAVSLIDLASLYNDRGDFAKAEPLYLRSLEIRERVLGREHPFVASMLSGIANVYSMRGDFVKAEALQRRALEIKEKSLAPGHPDFASSYTNLARIHWIKGDTVKAEGLFQRALEIKEKALGPEHRDLVPVLANLAALESSMGNLAKAEQLYRRGLDINEKAFGPNHLSVARALTHLGEFYYSAGDYTKAEPFYLRALEITEKVLGPEHRAVADTIDDLAMVYRFSGDLVKAEKLIHRALEIREKVFGPEHTEVARSYSCLAIFYAAKGDATRALKAELRAAAITERNVALNLLTGSDREKLAYMTYLDRLAGDYDHSDHIISLNTGIALDDPEARELVATTIIQRKGRVLDAMSDSLSTLRRRFNAQDQTLLNRLNDTASQLARVVLDGPKGVSLVEYQKQVSALEEQRDKLESEISRVSAGSYERSQPVTLAAVQAAIPANAALIEFAVYRPFDPKPQQTKSSYGPTRYIAYVVRNGGEVRRQELGESAALDKSIDEFRKALRDPKRKDVQQLARAVDEKVTQPVRSLVGDATHLLISADGRLNLIPFEALVDERGKYLIERYSISYLTSGRDLLRMQVPRPSKTEAVVIANPQFEGSEIALAGKERALTPKSTAAGRKRLSVTAARDLSSVYFAPLDATALEASAIKSLFTDATVLIGPEASETALKRVDAPRILHIATHGFFLQDAKDAAADVGSDESLAGTRAINASVKVENPLLRSGLALAGANSKNAGSDDGIMTALEASSLNLWGTKLVTLSACDTGIGEVKNGEGVYGLRRAVMLAGVETLVMSMWPVSDYVTRDMMTAYYGGLKEGQGRGEALRQVKLSMLKRQDHRHPFYWASFIQLGEWANLEGKR